MHFLTFAFKRAHYTSLAVSRPLAAKFGLTPARFDLLCCARRLRDRAFQADIARTLGVSEVTVSRMVRAMEATGLVRRIRIPRDTRKRRIVFTKEGRRRYYLVLRKVQRKPLQRCFQSLAASMLCRSYEDVFLWLSSYARMIRLAANRLGDRATFQHPDWDFVDV